MLTLLLVLGCLVLLPFAVQGILMLLRLAGYAIVLGLLIWTACGAYTHIHSAYVWATETAVQPIAAYAVDQHHVK